MQTQSPMPGVLRAWLGGLSDGWATSNYGEATFSPFNVIGHLIHAERTNWMPRVRNVLAGAKEPFAPFDRYAMLDASAGKSLSELLETLGRERTASLSQQRFLNLTRRRWRREGLTRNPARSPWAS